VLSDVNKQKMKTLYTHRFSRVAGNMKRSAIRELLKLTQRPDIISFAGGLPSPDTFPVEDLKRIVTDLLEQDGASALQYSTTEGDLGLREELIKRYDREGLHLTPDRLVITTASQQGLDLIAKILLNPRDVVICGLPSYLGGISAFTSYGAQLVGIPFDEEGMRPDILENTLTELLKEGKKVKFIYLIPDFQNPAGVTLPEKRRKTIMRIAESFDLLVVEDSPYREIRFEGEPQPLLQQLDKSGRVVTLGTFSKILAPGFRLGWIIAPEEIIEKFVIAKQTADLCTPIFTQKTVERYLKSGNFDKNLQRTIALYREKRDVMLEGLHRHMPDGVTWTRPEGGLFLFLQLPPRINAEAMLKKAIGHKVAFVAGSVFFCTDCGQNTMRINFSYASIEENKTGIKRLAKVIRDELK
jgi:2-aminoadipate transaminase